MVFHDWLLSFRIMFSGFVYVEHESALRSFLWLNNIPLCGYVGYSFISSWTSDWTHCLIIMNNPTMNICVQVLCEHVFNFPGHTPRRVTAGSPCFTVLFLRTFWHNVHFPNLLVQEIFLFFPKKHPNPLILGKKKPRRVQHPMKITQEVRGAVTAETVRMNDYLNRKGKPGGTRVTP